jgi:hypothetical protein
LQHAVDLDPRRIGHAETDCAQLSSSTPFPPRQKSVLERALAVEPNNIDIKLELAAAEFYWKADTRPLHQWSIRFGPTNPAATREIAEYWLYYALADRDAAAAKKCGWQPVTTQP